MGAVLNQWRNASKAIRVEERTATHKSIHCEPAINNFPFVRRREAEEMFTCCCCPFHQRTMHGCAPVLPLQGPGAAMLQFASAQCHTRSVSDEILSRRPGQNASDEVPGPQPFWTCSICASKLGCSSLTGAFWMLLFAVSVHLSQF